jgi:arylsulfatase A-like enzyme
MSASSGRGRGAPEHRWPRWSGFAALLTAGIPFLLLVTACTRPQHPSILLVTIDTLRPDHLGCYGYGRPVSPHIDALARESTLFERAATTLPRTTQSVASILTGRLPKSHGARGLFARLPATNTTLAEILKRDGYETAAIVSNTFLRPGQGFEQGFDLYDNPEGRWDANAADAVTDAAVRWLEGRPGDRPFFLWVHYLDPHWRYEPPAPWDRAFDPDWDRPFTLYDDLAAGRVTKGEVIFGNVLDEGQTRHVVALYDGEIARTDAAVGALLERVAAHDRKLITVLTSDHGESLGEHGYHFAHGEYLYEPGLRIPLLVRAPGLVPAGARVDAAALNIDIAPTLLALAGVAGLQGVEGRPLFARARGGSEPGWTPAPGRDLTWAESDYQLIHPENPRYYLPGPRGRWSAASDGRYKLILIPRPGGDTYELYDLASDPGETSNIVASPDLAGVRARLLRGVLEFADYGTGPPGARQVRPPGAPGARPGVPRDDADPMREMSPEEIERLRSLGYIN